MSVGGSSMSGSVRSKGSTSLEITILTVPLFAGEFTHPLQIPKFRQETEDSLKE